MILILTVSRLANSKYRLFDEYVASSVSEYHNDEDTSRTTSQSVHLSESFGNYTQRNQQLYTTRYLPKAERLIVSLALVDIKQNFIGISKVTFPRRKLNVFIFF